MRLLLAITVLITSLPISTPPVRASVFRPATHTSSPGQDPPPTPNPSPTPDPVLEQAERDAKLAEELKKKAVADQERAEAEAARLKALTQPFGSPANVSVPTGSVTTDAAGWIESQMLAHEAARQITIGLTNSLCTEGITPGASATPGKIKTLVIYSRNDLAGVELYGTIMGQLTRLKNDVAQKKREAEGLLKETDPIAAPSPGTTDIDPITAFAAPGIATGVIKSVAELINLFRTDTSFTNQAITLTENTIVSHIVRNLNTRTAADNNCDTIVRLYYPALYAPGLLDTSENSALISVLDDLQTAKVEAAANVEKLDARIKQLKDFGAAIESRDKKLKERKAREDEKTAKDEEIKKKGCNNRTMQRTPECQKLATESKALGEQMAQLDADIKKLNDGLKDVTADSKNFKDWIERLTDLRAKTQALMTAIDLISAKLNTPDETTKLTALAQLIRAERLHNILKAPGSYTLHVQVKANGTTKIKKNMFVDAKVRHSAGADLTYQLIEGGGVIAQARELKCYIEYQSARDVQNMVSGTANGVACKFQDKPTTPDANRPAGQASRGRPARRTANYE